MIDFTCKHCGAEGRCFPSQRRQFCSMPCRSAWYAERKMPTKPRRGTTEPCEQCGAPVYRSKGQSRRFCSVGCHNASQRKDTTTRPCIGCGAVIEARPSDQRKFCSRSCYEAHRIERSGIGRHHNGRQVIRDGGGYLRIWQPDHPAAVQGRILEHRWVVEQELGRHLATEEHVHHINGVKDDNRPENLAVLDAQEHRLLTAAELKAQREADAAELAEYRRRYGALN